MNKSKLVHQDLEYHELLNKSELLLSVTESGVWDYDVDRDFLVWDDRMFEIYGVDKAKFKNKFADWQNCVHPEDIDKAIESFQESVATGGKFSYVFRIILPNKEIRHIRAAAKAILDDGGKTVKMMGINQDFTPYVLAEKKAMKSAELYKTFIKQSPIATAMLDLDMCYIAASEKWISDYGLKEKELIGKSHYELFPEIGDEWKNIHRECLKGKGQSCSKDRFERADGSVQYIRWDIQPWFKADSSVGGLIMFTEDITNFILNEEAHIQLSTLLQETQSLARIGAWDYNVNANSLYWDKVTKDIHKVASDYTPNVDEAINFYKQGYSLDTISQKFSEALSRKKPYDVELQIIDAEGNEKWVRAIGKPIIENGKVVRVSGLFQDIDDSKRQQIDLTINNNMFEGAFEHSPNGMALVSLDGQWMRVNNQICEMLGYQEEELLELTFQEVTHPDDLNSDLLLLQETLDGKRNNYHMEKRYIRSNGESFWAMLSVSLIRDGHNQPQYFVSQIKDINAKKIAEARLNDANDGLRNMADRLSTQNKSLSDFAHITSHNLRAPVGNLMALNELYEGSESSEMKDEIFKKIDSETKRLSETLNNLVETLVIRESAFDGEKTIDLNQIIDNIASSLETQIAITGFQIEKELEVSRITSNPQYIESIFQNLITNAIKYRREDVTPTLIIRSFSTGKALQIEFEDNGLGINLKRHKHKVFGLNKTFHRNSDAKGVGLFMVKAHVEALKGSITVDSEPNEGSTFVIRFNATHILKPTR